jgi:hypothetical protein
MKKIFLVIITAFSINASAQKEPSSLIKDKELLIMVGPAATRIKNASISADENKSVNRQNGFNFNFEFVKYVKNRIGFGVGLGFSNYKQEYVEKGLFVQLSQVDRDGETYDKWMKVDLKYSDKLMYANIPLSVHLLLGNSPKFYGFLNVGIVNQFLVSGMYTMDGTTETMAVYATNNPYWDVITQNNTYYDMKQTTFSQKEEERYKFYNLSGHLSVGLAAAMTDRLFLRVEPFVNLGFSDIMGPDGKGKEYEDVFGQKTEYTPTKLFAGGLNVGFAFNLN